MLRHNAFKLAGPRLSAKPTTSFNIRLTPLPNHSFLFHSSCSTALIRSISTTPRRLDIPQWPNPPVPQPPVGPSDNLTSNSPRGKADKESFWKQWSSSASFQAALTTVVGLGMVFAAGVGYLEWYKAHVLHRIGRAFEPGYDPALELSTLHAPNSSHIHRREQPLIDRIVGGEEKGGYYLVIGSKGTGKGTMILDAMRKINADGVSFCEAHPDLEVFRLRLGKALDFDFYEDWQGSLFSRADPRNGGPALDVERALNKLEKVALRYARKNKRPLVMAFNNIHLFPNTPEGHGLLHQLQQRAEAWAEGGILTMIFSTDDFWCLDLMKKNASRMRILSVYDLSASESLKALRHLRVQALTNRGLQRPVEEDDVLKRVYELVGGRTSYLARVARADNMLEEAESMIEGEKQWLLSKIGLIPEHDDDVICSWLLLRHLSKMIPPLSPYPLVEPEITTSPIDNDLPLAVESPESETSNSSVNVTPPAKEPSSADIHLPYVTYEAARRIMTRTDFLNELDHYHVVSIDLNHHVRPDSLLLLRAAQQVVSEENFDDDLDTTRDRVDQIEGLHRQSELTVKEPFKVTFDKIDGKGVWEVVGLGDSFVPASEDDDEEDRLV
ncbi:hypothetical protein I302_106123 [Kwoniella bestiolae CBS 10118]|uniref:AAA protein C-terminal winged helix domain-containing protein n=1 Tax=Kwoniella bestiolae CBS 10118 TaxID=1296100 RepID=A0A1B9G325_9TREE|nr:hypothetical protein I302_05247 [Kwoniella bestiolae CBS 10118]OCF25427.1 hypothetical protein I302_05247 [Kwoniella bestiolae CBS 10118]